MKKQMKGLGFYAVIIGIIILATLLNNFDIINTKNYNETNFIADLKGDNIESIDFYQNEEKPTGKVEVVFKDDTKVGFYTPDVKEMRDEAIQAGKGKLYTMHNINKPSWILTTLMPIVLGFIVIILLFSFFMNQGAANSGNGKVMNFGKSRDRKSVV